MLKVTRRGIVVGSLAASAVHVLPRAGIAAQDSFSLSSFIPSGATLADYTQVFAEAISEAARLKVGRIFVPAGTFPVNGIKLLNGIVIEGAGRNATTISAIEGFTDSLVTLDSGPVLNAGLRNVSLSGGTTAKATNPGQWAMRLKSSAATTGKAHGGLWWSLFENVSANGFDKGIWFEGGGGDYLLPHQFVSLRDLVVYGNEASTGPGLRMSGQVNQFMFSQIHLDRFQTGTLEIVESPDGKASPKLHHFDVATMQGAEQAVTIAGGHNISFTNCWFEQNDAAILVRPKSFGISITGCRFANSGKKQGAVVFEKGASGSVFGNVFAGPYTKRSLNIADIAAVAASDNIFIWGAKE